MTTPATETVKIGDKVRISATALRIYPDWKRKMGLNPGIVRAVDNYSRIHVYFPETQYNAIFSEPSSWNLVLRTSPEPIRTHA